jgi:secretion/DNA translocation related CpaE-like protein
VVGWAPLSDAVFRDAVGVGADLVVELPDRAAALTEALADIGDRPRRNGTVVGVVGGSGGAGATTFACALAQVAGRSGRAMVVDLDPAGPGVDRVLGVDERPGVRWDDLAVAPGRLGATSLREALPRSGGVAALTWATGSTSALSAPAVREAVAAARRGHDVVVLDLPRSLDDVSAEAFTRCSTAVVVVRPGVTGVASATRVVARLPDRARVGLVLRGSAVDADRVATVVGAQVITTMADQRGLAESIDLGLGPVRSRRGPLARACREVLAALGSATRVAA